MRSSNNSSIDDGSGSDSGTWQRGLNRFVSSVKTGVANQQKRINDAREAKEAGKVWDPEKREWVFYLLDDEWEQVCSSYSAMESQESSSSAGLSSGSSIGGGGAEGEEERKVADREYYELLCVSTNADAVAIRKAYYKVARKAHPDKNPDDPDAHEKFQAIGHAYQVLSNEQTKAAYDKNGKAATTGEESMLQHEIDPFVFFNVMFGSTLVENYVGELWIATSADMMMKDGSSGGGLAALDETQMENLTEEERHALIEQKMEEMSEKSKLQQRKRQVQVARNIRDRIEPYCAAAAADGSNGQGANDQKLQFQQGCRNEAFKIVEGAYGAVYCSTIGFALQVAAEEYVRL